jgi:hypothetical protein
MLRSRSFARRLIAALAIVGVIVTYPHLAGAQTTTAPSISAGFPDPTFRLLVTGRGFTPSGALPNAAVVYVLGVSGVLERDVVPISASGTFSDATHVGCSVNARAVTAVDERSMTWSNQVVVRGPCL